MINYTADITENVGVSEDRRVGIFGNLLESVPIGEDTQRRGTSNVLESASISENLRQGGTSNIEEEVFVVSSISAQAPLYITEVVGFIDFDFRAHQPLHITERVEIREIYESAPVINLRYRSKLKPLFLYAELRK